MIPVSGNSRRGAFVPEEDKNEDVPILPTLSEVREGLLTLLFSRYLAQEIPPEMREELKGACQLITCLSLENGRIWPKDIYSKSLLEVVIGFLGPPEDVYPFCKEILLPENRDRVPEIYQRFENEVLRERIPLEKRHLPEVKKLFSLLNLIFVRNPQILFYSVEAIFGLGQTKQFILGLHKIGLIPAPNAEMTIQEGVSVSFLRWYCREFSKDEAASRHFIEISHQLASNYPVSEEQWKGAREIKGLTDIQKNQLELYQWIFEQLEKKKCGNLYLNKIVILPDVQDEIAGPVALPEEEIASYYRLWQSQIAIFNRELQDYAREIRYTFGSLLDAQYNASVESTRGRKQTRVIDRQQWESKVKAQSKELAALEAFEKETDRFNRKYRSRLVALEHTLQIWEKNKEITPVFLAQLESCSRWIAVNLSPLESKAQQMEKDIHELILSQRTSHITKKKDADGERVNLTIEFRSKIAPNLLKNLQEEMDTLKKLVLLISSIKSVSKEIQCRMQILKTAAVKEQASVDFLLELEDTIAEASQPEKVPEEHSFESDEKEPSRSVSPTRVPVKTEIPKTVVAQTFSAQVSQVLASWELSPEVADHLFLATQSIELMSQLYARKRYDLLGVCLQSYLLDCHTALEHFFEKKNSSHSLVRIAQDLRWKLSSEEMQFLKDHDQSLLWARYPAYYFERVQNNVPPPLSWLRALQEVSFDPKTVNPDQIKSIFSAIVGSYKMLFRMVGQDRISPSFFSHLDEMISSPSKSSDRERNGNPYRKMREILEKGIQESGYAQMMTDEDPLLYLKEVRHYLLWLEQAKTLRSLFPHPKWDYWMARVNLNTDKIFKHLFTADCILNDLGLIQTHNLRVYIQTLDHVRHFDDEKRRLLSAININIGHHYIHGMNFPLSDECRSLLEQSKEEELSAATDFEMVVRARRESNLETLFHKSLDLFSSFLTLTLEKLRQVDRDKRAAIHLGREVYA